MIVYYCLIVPNFVVEESVVVLVLSLCRVQKYLVRKYYLVGQHYSKYFCMVVVFD